MVNRCELASTAPAKELSRQRVPMYNRNAVRLYLGISCNSYLQQLPVDTSLQAMSNVDMESAFG